MVPLPLSQKQSGIAMNKTENTKEFQENKCILEESGDLFGNEPKADLSQILKQFFMGPLFI